MKSVYLPVAFALTLLAFWAYQVVRVNTPPNFVLMHNVWIKARTGKYSFRAVVRNPGTNEWNEFILKGCPDFEPTREIQTGVTLRMLQYVEDRTNSCMELDGNYAGYTLLRDDHDNPIISANPWPLSGSPTTSARSNQTARSERPDTEAGR